jgi:hypothetical protein
LFRQQVRQAFDGSEPVNELAQTAVSDRPWQAQVLGPLELLLNVRPVKPAPVQQSPQAFELAV